MSTIQSKLPTVARYLLGLTFFVFGLNGFLHFIPQPPMSGPPANFLGAMLATGYLFPLVKGTEVLAGLLFLSNRYVPLALAVLAPVLINIVAFHVFLEPAALALPLVLLAAEVYLAASFRDAFAPMLQARNTPHANPPASGRPRVPVTAS
ncbi:MAG TPA: DoxX family protein [Polyangiaceae bacterium]|jgi:hypothetical protein|nr:DoxX family protein [Polyangiaceae bacterium]